MTYRPSLVTLPPILISLSRKLVSDYGSRSSHRQRAQRIFFEDAIRENLDIGRPSRSN
jgi:hypothetical protein